MYYPPLWILLYTPMKWNVWKKWNDKNTLFLDFIPLRHRQIYTYPSKSVIRVQPYLHIFMPRDESVRKKLNLTFLHVIWRYTYVWRNLVYDSRYKCLHLWFSCYLNIWVTIFAFQQSWIMFSILTNMKAEHNWIYWHTYFIYFSLTI